MRASTSSNSDYRRQGIMGQSSCRTRPWALRRIWTSIFSDLQNLNQLSKSPYRSLLLTFIVLAMFFLSSRAFRRTLYPLDSLRGARSRVRPDPCSINLPEELWVDDGGGRGLSDGRPLPQGDSLLGRLGLGIHPSIGVVNMDFQEALEWQEYAQGRMPVHFPFALVNQSLQWSDFYPEWIDEGELSETPECPPLPFPCVHQDLKLDLVIATVPCPNGERDVHRLQVLLSAASVASQTGDKEMNVLIISECRPSLNIFPCRELLEHEKNMWLYRVNLANMRSRLALPVGSCELSLSVDYPGNTLQHSVREMVQHWNEPPSNDTIT